MLEIESVEALVAHIEAHGGLEGVVVQGLDLREQADRVCAVSVKGAVFLGGQLGERVRAHATAGAATIFPVLPGLPYKVYRSGLYTLAELMEGYRRGVPGSFERDALDSHIYAHFQRHKDSPGPTPIMEALAQRLHDHGVDDALDDLLTGGAAERRVVAIMGGHAVTRDSPIYTQVARMARTLTRRGYFVATGGGPGVMEAGNLGAWFAPFEDAALEGAIEVLARAPSFRLPGYLDRGYEVLDAHPEGGESLAIPTWFYGHEPTNQFSTHIAKYFSNSLREDGLLAIAKHGVIYAPGSAGTIQEVFMDAAQNHYGTFEVVSPMVFLGRDFWTADKPVYDLVQRLAGARQYAHMLALEDDVDAIVAFIEAHPPAPYVEGGH